MISSQQDKNTTENIIGELDKIYLEMEIRTDHEALESLRSLRQVILAADSKILRDAAAVLKREGKAYQRDLSERIDACLDGMSVEKTDVMPVPLIRRYDAAAIADDYEQERRMFYEKADKIRNRVSDEKTKRDMYVMIWELPEDELENLLILFREAMVRYFQMHRNIFDDPQGVKEIRYRLALLGITEVVPEKGVEFDPSWHLHSDPQKTGFSYRISKTVHAGYKRNGRRILKAIVEVE